MRIRACAAGLTAMLGLVACQPTESIERASGGPVAPLEPGAALVGEQVATMMEELAAGLAARGPEVWMDFFVSGPEFFMASDGELKFPDHGVAAEAMAQFGPTVQSMLIGWKQLRIEPLTDDLASVAAGYDESIILVTGEVLRFGGYVTGLAARTDDGWKFRHLHWSSPPPVP